MQQSLLPSKIHSFLLATGAVLIAIALVIYPDQAVYASLRGLKIWWEVVFPALLPFFITAEIMMGVGVVRFLEVLLEPFMRPIFRVPGSGAFVMIVGLISGNPMGAKLTARLRETKMISREEGERLISFTSTAGPLFIFGAVGVGLFKSTSIGLLLAITHYGSSILLGILMRFYKYSSPLIPHPSKQSGFFLIRAFEAMHIARIRDGRSIGQLLREAVTSAIQTLLLIGGFIIIFSVITHILQNHEVSAILSRGINFLLTTIGFPTLLTPALFGGIFEMTLGSQLASSISHVPLIYQCTIASIVIAFGGLSIHAQIASMISRTDIRYLPYFWSRLLHAFIAGVMTFVLYYPLRPYLHDLPTHVPTISQSAITTTSKLWNILHIFSILVLIIWFVLLWRELSKSR